MPATAALYVDEAYEPLTSESGLVGGASVLGNRSAAPAIAARLVRGRGFDEPTMSAGTVRGRVDASA